MPLATLERPQKVQHSMLSLPALSRRFVEDFTATESLGLRFDVDLGVAIDWKPVIHG